MKKKEEITWLIHNTIAHPIMGYCRLLSLLINPKHPKLAKIVKTTGVFIHDITLPKGHD